MFKSKRIAAINGKVRDSSRGSQINRSRHQFNKIIARFYSQLRSFQTANLFALHYWAGPGEHKAKFNHRKPFDSGTRAMCPSKTAAYYVYIWIISNHPNTICLSGAVSEAGWKGRRKKTRRGGGCGKSRWTLNKAAGLGFFLYEGIPVDPVAREEKEIFIVPFFYLNWLLSVWTSVIM